MWNTLEVDISLDDLLARPVIGAGGFTRDEAHSQIQKILDVDPRLSRAAEQWRMDVQRVRVGSRVWTTYEYQVDLRAAALSLLDDGQRSFRAAGIAIRVMNSST
jgi:hypothetical protein